MEPWLRYIVAVAGVVVTALLLLVGGVVIWAFQHLSSMH